MEIDRFKRHQKIKFIDFAPKTGNVCGCGCGVVLTGRKTRWASKECMNKLYLLFSIIKGNNSAIRRALFNIDKGFCRHCGQYHKNGKLIT
jgi:hypothetical protein